MKQFNIHQTERNIIETNKISEDFLKENENKLKKSIKMANEFKLIIEENEREVYILK